MSQIFHERILFHILCGLLRKKRLVYSQYSSFINSNSFEEIHYSKIWKHKNNNQLVLAMG